MSTQFLFTKPHAARAPLAIAIPSTVPSSEYLSEKAYTPYYDVSPLSYDEHDEAREEPSEPELELADERDRDVTRAMDRLCILAVLIVDMVLLAEVLGPWSRASIVTLYYPSGIFLELCSVLCWVAARAGSCKNEVRAALSVWAMGGLATLFLIEAYLNAPPALVPPPNTAAYAVWNAYVVVLGTVFAAGVGIIVRAFARRCKRLGGGGVIKLEGPERI